MARHRPRHSFRSRRTPRKSVSAWVSLAELSTVETHRAAANHNRGGSVCFCGQCCLSSGAYCVSMRLTRIRDSHAARPSSTAEICNVNRCVDGTPPSVFQCTSTLTQIVCSRRPGASLNQVPELSACADVEDPAPRDRARKSSRKVKFPIQSYRTDRSSIGREFSALTRSAMAQRTRACVTVESAELTLPRTIFRSASTSLRAGQLLTAARGGAWDAGSERHDAIAAIESSATDARMTRAPVCTSASIARFNVVDYWSIVIATVSFDDVGPNKRTITKRSAVPT